MAEHTSDTICSSAPSVRKELLRSILKISVWFLRREGKKQRESTRKGVDLDGWQGEKDLEETVIRIHYMKKIYFQ